MTKGTRYTYSRSLADKDGEKFTIKVKNDTNEIVSVGSDNFGTLVGGKPLIRLLMKIHRILTRIKNDIISKFMRTPHETPHYKRIHRIKWR